MKHIAYVTGSRAEYGIVKRLLHKLQADKELKFTLLVTAMHLLPEYGHTVDVIYQDGFEPVCLPIALDSGSNQAVLTSMAECLAVFGKHFQDNHYDAVIVLGDRYEMLAVATAAAMHNIPLIHLHGGEQTLGNYDEFIRHCISKMSKLHLTATEQYRHRVIQLGEMPESVINTGSLGAENSLCLKLPEKVELLQRLNIPSDKPYFLVVFHPETLNEQPVASQINELLAALDLYKATHHFVFIGSNSDTHSDVIFKRFQEYTQENSFPFFTSVKPEDYLALIKYSQGIIGNSSSGLIEAPSCGVATLNIGNRQQGRVRGDSVLDVAIERGEIAAALRTILSTEYQNKLPEMENPYFKANAMENAYAAIKQFLANEQLNVPKAFYDLPTN